MPAVLNNNEVRAMVSRVIEEASEAGELAQGEASVLHAITCHLLDAESACVVSSKTLMAKSFMKSEATFHKHKQSLAAKGYIIYRAGKRNAKGTQDVNVYALGPKVIELENDVVQRKMDLSLTRLQNVKSDGKRTKKPTSKNEVGQEKPTSKNEEEVVGEGKMVKEQQFSKESTCISTPTSKNEVGSQERFILQDGEDRLAALLRIRRTTPSQPQEDELAAQPSHYERLKAMKQEGDLPNIPSSTALVPTGWEESFERPWDKA